MADAKIVDIKGVQWELKDEVARDKITELEKNLVAQDLEDININLNSGYTALLARFTYHYKVGKIHFAKAEFRDISGENIGTTATAKIGLINIIPKKETTFILYDYQNSAILRCYIDEQGQVAIGESVGVAQGNNICYGELIFVEK